MPVKVLCVITGSMGYEGITAISMKYAAHYDERVQVDFVSPKAPPEGIRLQAEQMGGKIFVTGSRVKRPVRYIRRLKKIVREGGYDAVHVNGSSCLMALDLWAAKAGGARVRIAHSHNTYCRHRALHALLRPAFDRLYTHAWACGEEAGKWLFRERPFRIARIGVETERFAFDEAARRQVREQFAPEGETLILCAANFLAAKNHGFLLEAFAGRTGKSRLILAGDGLLRGEIEGKIRALGLEKDALPLGRRDDVAQLMQGCDILALPSLHEGFPNVLMEAQCAGMEILASENVTRRADVTGLIRFLPLEKAAWAAALSEKAPGNREEQSARAVKRIAQAGYDMETCAREMEKFYLETAGEKET